MEGSEEVEEVKTLIDMPEDVYDYIFPFLHLSDLLRLRGVNKFLKTLAEAYLQVYVTPNRSFTFTISEDGTTNLSPLLALSFVAPLSKCYIINFNSKSFEIDQLQQFADIYGSRVTHLQLSSLEIPIVSRKAIRFFESFQNLEYLEVYEVDERGRFSEEKRKNRAAQASRNLEEVADLIPSTFRRLRTLLIREYKYAPNPPQDSFALIWKFIEECSSPHLESLAHPSILDFRNLPEGRFGTVLRMLEGNQLPNLKTYDLECFLEAGDVHPVIRDFHKLATACSRHQVKLQNVNGYLIEGMMALEIDNIIDMGEHGWKLSQVVHSIQNLHLSSFLLEFPHLEKITIGPEEGTWGNCTMPDHFAYERKAWPNLKELSILIDSSKLYDDESMEFDEADMDSAELLNYFFVGIRREKMEKLSLKFHLHEDLLRDTLPYPRIIDVCNSCPNLKELTISEWPGTNKAISKLWGGLPLLEKVKFDGCSGLGNVAFVGEDKDNPELVRAQNLRSLTLERFEIMPKITDSLFALVLRHMPLKELTLISVTYDPISNSKITLAGILGLRDGVFAETIEKLLLDFRMEGVTAEELKAVGEEFRSSKM